MAAGRRRSDTRELEQYQHAMADRVNNPPVGLVTAATDPDPGTVTRYKYNPHDAPVLNWAGKEEKSEIVVPLVSLHVHERIDARTILDAVRNEVEGDYQPSFFDSPVENPPLRKAIEFYAHRHGWSNRLIAGDSLLVMNSLLEKEGMAGAVQMAFFDPPYGIKYGSNFQPFVDKRDVKDGKDEDLTAEPEMIRAFRDTWELGIHSYLSYLRDRLRLMHALLADTGFIFAQINDDNQHLVRALLDEHFGPQNFVAHIAFRKKTGPLGAGFVASLFDYLVCYAKNKDQAASHFRKLYEERSVEGDSIWRFVQLPDGTRRAMSGAELGDHRLLPPGSRVFRKRSLSPAGFNASATFDFVFEGKAYHPPFRAGGASWTTNEKGLERLAKAGRLVPTGETLDYVYFHDDFPLTEMTNVWADTRGATDKIYAVQTDMSIVERCMLMTTEPGDLVFDPTCGSGTMAAVAEQWGRRWITCDTSRIAVALTRQRLMTSSFPFYTLARPAEGVDSGFRYRTLPHVTLKSIAGNESIDSVDASRPDARNHIERLVRSSAAQESLWNEPAIDNQRARVAGPFTVESVPAPTVRPIDDLAEARLAAPSANGEPPFGAGGVADESLARSGATIRHAEWRSELLTSGIRGRSGQRLTFASVDPLPGTRWLHAEAIVEPQGEDAGGRAVVSFGPEYAPMDSRQVELAWEEARTLDPRPRFLIFMAFTFDPEAAHDIDELDPLKVGMTFLKVQMNTDLLTTDLKKKQSSNEPFWLVGQPDISLQDAGDGRFTVRILGFDYFNVKTGAVESGDSSKVAMWMLDTDYDGRSLYPRQVFFPTAGAKNGWARLANTLRSEIDLDLIKAYRGTTSLAFEFGRHRRVAVKIIDHRGIESMTLLAAPTKG